MGSNFAGDSRLSSMCSMRRCLVDVLSDAVALMDSVVGGPLRYDTLLFAS